MFEGERERVAAFSAALTARSLESDTSPGDEVDTCPWSAILDRSGRQVIRAMGVSRVGEVAPVVFELAAQHDLRCFDPQEGEVRLPPRLRQHAGSPGDGPGPGWQGAWGRLSKWMRRGVQGTRGDALVEAALVLPVLLLLAFGVVGVGRVVHAHGAVGAVAREAAVAGAASRAPAEAARRAHARAREVAQGHHLSPAAVDLQIVPGRFDRSPGDAVAVTAGYDVALADLPLLGWARHRVQGRHVVPIDPHRSR